VKRRNYRRERAKAIAILLVIVAFAALFADGLIELNSLLLT
jgi:hypothetical protein